MVAPQHQVDLTAPVVLASQPADGPRPRIEGSSQQQDPDRDQGVSASQMLHTASLTREIGPPADKPVADAAKPKPIKLAEADPLAQADPLAPRPAKSGSHANAKANAKDAGRKQ